MTNEDENRAQTGGPAAAEETYETRRMGQGPGRPPSKKQRILAYIADRGWDLVNEENASELAGMFPDCSEDTVHAALLESGIPLVPVVEGVHQDSYRHLEDSLNALLAEYLAAQSDSIRRQFVRSVVIRAREHADLAAHNPKTHQLKRDVKVEMALWLHTWLENPPLFPAWVELRKRRAIES